MKIGLLIIGGIITLFVIAIIVVKKIKSYRNEKINYLGPTIPFGNNKSERSDIFEQKDRIGTSAIASSPVEPPKK